MDLILHTALTGMGATLVMDSWGLARRALLDMAPPDYRMVGRWLGHMAHGQFRHAAIGKSPAIAAELLLGWLAHYATGIAFSAILIGVAGPQWLRQPMLAPALLTGVLTVAAPFFLMQPAMGAGIAASRTPRPNHARLHSLLNHAVFGCGLYLAARLLN